MIATYHIRLFGTVQVENEGQLIRTFESRKALAMLGYLIRHDQPVSRSQLAGLFWGEKTEARGRRNLSRELSQLSNRVADCFVTDYHTVQFQPTEAHWVDVLTFERLIEEAGQLEDATSLLRHLFAAEAESAVSIDADALDPAKLEEAVALYRGDFMAGYYLDDCPEFEAWLVREQEQWRRTVTGLLETLLAYYTAQGQDRKAETQVRRWLALEPWQEDAHRYLMMLLARAGKRAAAMAQYDRCVRALEEELGAEPEEETQALYQRIQAGEITRRSHQPPDVTGALKVQPQAPTAAGQAPSDQKVRVPVPKTSLVDRTDELAQLLTYLDDPTYRLMTLVGPGGVGKTRLAIQAALKAAKAKDDAASVESGQNFSHGIYFIALDSLNSPEFLVPTLADALDFSFYSGADPATQLLNYLSEKQLLLVLDNFEQLLSSPQGPVAGGTDLVGDILAQAAGVKIIAVSRERLNLMEEHLVPLQGLAVPALPDRLDDNVVEAVGPEVSALIDESYAVRLFIQRGQSVQPGFDPSLDDKFYIAHICHLVEGIPLAIELAAAWLRMLSCREIAQEIKQNLDFLATSLRNVPERQRSVRAVFDYSWQLLSADERRIFRQLAVFQGGFLREAAEQVVGASLPQLLALTDKSLMLRHDSGRYDRHRLVWQYAMNKLDEHPAEKAKAQARHSRYYAAFLADRNEAMLGGQQRETLAEIRTEIENIRLGWQWAIEQRNVEVIDQAQEGLFNFYDIRSWFQEGADTFEQAIAAFSGSGVAREEEQANTTLILGKLRARRGWFLFQLGRHEAGKGLLSRGLETLREAGGPARAGLIFPLNYLGAIERHLGDYEAANRHLTESLALCRETGDAFGEGVALTILGQAAYLQGELAEARRLGEESLAVKQQSGDRRGETFALNVLGQVAETLGDYAEAKSVFQKSLAICEEIGDDRGVALSLSNLGGVGLAEAEPQGARQLFQDSLAIFKEIGNQWGQIAAHTRLGDAALLLTEFDTAREHYTVALELALHSQATPPLIEALVGVADLMRHTDPANWPQILEILTFALNHQAGSRDTRDRAARLLADLAPLLPEGAVATVQTGDSSKSLDEVVRGVLGGDEG